MAHLPRESLKGHRQHRRSKGINVNSFSKLDDLVILTPKFRCHKPWCANSTLRCGINLSFASKPEIEDFQATLHIKFYIIWLNVAMDSTCSVNIRNPASDCVRNSKELISIRDRNEVYQVVSRNVFLDQAHDRSDFIFYDVVDLNDMLGANGGKGGHFIQNAALVDAVLELLNENVSIKMSI